MSEPLDHKQTLDPKQKSSQSPIDLKKNIDPKQKNMKLLKVIENKLSSIDDYNKFVEKLTDWATDPRAYYPEVQLKIIEIIERALHTLRVALGIDPKGIFNVHEYSDNTHVQSYRKLVATVYGFRDRFPTTITAESAPFSLRTRLQALYMTITRPEIIDVDAMISSPPPPPPPTHSVNPEVAFRSNSALISTTVGPQHPRTISPAINSGSVPHLSNPSYSRTVSSPAVNPGLNHSSNPTPPPVSYSISFPVVDSASYRPTLSYSTPPPPMVNDSKQILSETPQNDFSPVPLKPRKKKKLKAHRISTQDLEDLDMQEVVMRESEPKTSYLGESQTSDPTPSVEVQMSRGSQGSPPVGAGTSAYSGSLVSVHSIGSDQKMLFERESSVSNGPNFLDVAMKSQSPALDPLERELPSLNIPHRMHSLSTGRVSQSPLNFLDQAFMTPPPSASLSFANLTHRSPIEGTIKSEDREVCHPEVADAMDVDLEPVEQAEVDVDVAMPLATLTEKRQKPNKVLLPNCAGFGKHFTTSKQEGGKKKDTSISMHFSVNQHQFTSIQNWNHRMITPIHEDRRDTLCLSLACYLKAEMGRNPNYDELKPSWPRGNQLHLEVTKQDGKTRSIPLAPPNASVLIPDGFVDIGSYIRLNENTIKLVQDGDLFAYVYCLHIHLPTLAQVQKLNQQIEKQEEWETWCKNVSGPLDLPPSKFSTGSIHMHML